MVVVVIAEGVLEIYGRGCQRYKSIKDEAGERWNYRLQQRNCIAVRGKVVGGNDGLPIGSFGGIGIWKEAGQ